MGPMNSSSLRHVFQDPTGELGYPRANARQIGFSTSDAPADDASQEISAVLATDL